MKALRSHSPLVPRDGGGSIKTPPAHELRPPGKIGVFTIRKESFVVKFTGHAHIVNHRAAVERGSSSRAEDVFHFLIFAGVDRIGATIEMAQIGKKIDAGRIYEPRPLRLFGGIPAQQLAAQCADSLIERGAT